MKRAGWFLVFVASAACLAAAAPYDGGAFGNETVNYSYDELGRLTGSNTTGGVNNTRTTGTCFDKAGNRARYDVSNTTIASCPS